MKPWSLYKAITINAILLASCCGVPINPHTHSKESYECLSPESIVTDTTGKSLYIADVTARRVTVFDIEANSVKDIIQLKNNPGGIAVAPDGSCVYVASGSSEGMIEIIDLHHGGRMKSIPTGHTPCAPVVSPDGKTVYVCNRFDNSVSVIDLAAKKEIDRIPMLREPIAADITPDGKYLFVANHLPSGRVLQEYVRDGGIMMIGSYVSQGTYGGGKMDYAASGVVLVVDTSRRRLSELIPIRDGAIDLRGVCVSPDGRYVYVTHTLANYKLPTEHIERGSINANALSIIEVKGMKLLNTVLLDDIGRGAANPWDVECSPDGKYICVTHAGTHEISVIDRLGLHKKLEEAENHKTAHVDISRDLTFLAGLRRRFPLRGEGPRDMAIVGTKVYAAEYFSDSVGVIDLESPDNDSGRSIALGPKAPLSEKRRGEMLFNDARICFQEWQSCASCHPDGRTDGLTWDLLNDGTGNPRKTKSLLLSHKTPPSMITGVRADAETAVRAGLKFIHFSGQPEETAAAIDAYLKSLRPVPSPYLQRGKPSKEAKRGQKIFNEAGCAECHAPPLYTNLKKNDVGAGTVRDGNRSFDTPSLIEAWRTAPYLYDGRAESMHEVLTIFNKKDTHGLTSKLNYSDLYDLAEFVLSL